MSKSRPAQLLFVALLAGLVSILSAMILYFSLTNPEIEILFYGEPGAGWFDITLIGLRSLFFLLLVFAVFQKIGFYRFLFAVFTAFDIGFSYLMSPFPALLLPYILVASGILALLFLPTSQLYFKKNQ